MAIKMIVPPDDNQTTDFETVGKMVQVVVNNYGTIEWKPQNASLKKGEAEYIARFRGVKGKIPVTRYQDIKTAILERLSLAQIAIRYRGKKGYTIAEIKGVSAALSAFNKWKRKP